LGRIDLNNADGALLVSLFESVGLDAASAGNVVDKILDWRDTSPLKRLNGAKDRDYRQAGYPYGPRNGPFQGVDELKLVMGMTPELFGRVEAALTVYSGRPRFDPQVAPREALLAMPSMDAATVDALIAARTQQTGDASYAGTAITGGFGDPVDALKGRAFTIRTRFETQDRLVTREATIRISGNPDQPYWVLHWQRK
jgi:general secretion pathway protein K